MTVGTQAKWYVNTAVSKAAKNLGKMDKNTPKLVKCRTRPCAMQNTSWLRIYPQVSVGLCLLVFVDLLNQKYKFLEEALAELVFFQRVRHHGKPYWFSYPWNRIQVPDSPSTGREKGPAVRNSYFGYLSVKE